MNLNERLGAAIQKAAGDLPPGYQIDIEIESGAGTPVLWIPPVCDEVGGRRVIDFAGDDIAEEVDDAIRMAIDHFNENRLMGANAKLTGRGAAEPEETKAD